MKKSKSRYLVGIALCLAGALYFGDRWLLQKRNVASLEGEVRVPQSMEVYDLSELSGEAFNKAFKLALAQGFEIQKDAQSLGLLLGGFLVKNPQGAKVYVCEVYPFLEITLQAEGVAYSGNIPSMIVRGPCLTSDDGKKINALPLPLRNLPQNLRSQPLWRVPLGDRGDDFVVSTQYLYDEWPTNWNVVRVKLSNEQTSLELDGYEIISLLDQTLTLDFSQEL